MNPSRLAELNHQRALVQEQLAWLEREIAQESGESARSPVSVAPRPVDQTVSPAQLDPAIEAFRPDTASAVGETRRGCLMAVALIAVLSIAAVTAIYFLRYSDRSLFFMSGEKDPGRMDASPGAAGSTK